jgi:Ca2+-binding EF-hand superfamily protein
MRIPRDLCQSFLLTLILAPALLAQAPARGRGGFEGPEGSRGGPPQPILRALDTDHDGTLSREEIVAAPKSLLTLDKNGDGVLTPEEVQPQQRDRPAEGASGPTPNDLAQQLMAFDKNRDGVLTPDELPARYQNLFVRADTDHDGKLTPAELRAVAAKQAPPPGLPEEHGGGFRDPLTAALDTNHDGTLSSAEIAAATTSLLTLDANHDGSISPDEMGPRPRAGRDSADGERRGPSPNESTPQPN